MRAALLPLRSLISSRVVSSSTCNTHIFRVSYSSSKRLLQTATATQPSSSSSLHGGSLVTKPPPPRNSSVGSSITNPNNETLSRPPPPPPLSPSPSLSSSSLQRQNESTPPASATTTTTKTPRPKLRARKAAMTLTPLAVSHLQSLLSQPDPKLIRVGVKNRGCSGLAYHLEYVDKPGKFDEEVVQDGVRVLIDSKALFSIIGSEMDWVEDKLSRRFVFRNPNIKEQCGCGESFSVA